MISEQIGEAAAQYAAAGLYVFPCAAKSKLPVAGSGGFRDATDDEAAINAIWQDRPTLNVALALGASGLFAVDVEVADHPWLEMLPPTWAQRTPAGGWHFLYRQPQGTPIPSVPLGQLAVDVEIKGDGGYVLLAPSRATSKKLNGALGAYAIAHAMAPADAPQWIVDMVRARESQRRKAQAQVYSAVRVGGEAEGRIAALLDELRGASDGSKNNTLISVSASMGRIVAGGYLSASDAEARLQSVVAPWGNPRKDYACIRRGLARGQASQPWYPDTLGGLSPEDDAFVSRLLRSEFERLDGKKTAPEDSGAVGAETDAGEATVRETVAESRDDVQRSIYARLRALGGLCDTYPAWLARGAVRHQPLWFALSAVVLGSVLAARQYVYRGSTSPVYALIVGGTSAGKNRPQRCLGEVLAAAAPETKGPGNMVSSKALWKTLGEAAGAGHGVCYLLDEFGELLATWTSPRKSANQADIYGWVLKLATVGTGTETWGNSVADGGKLETVRMPSLSIMGGSTPSSLFAAVRAKQASDGFLGRILIGVGLEKQPPKRRDAWREADDIPAEVLAGLHAIWQRAKKRARDIPAGATKIDVTPVVVQETPGAGVKFDTWDEENDQIGGPAGDLKARALELGQRVALCLAVLRTPDADPIVDEDVADVAISIVDFCMSSVAQVVEEHGAENETERAFKAVASVVREVLANGGKVPLRDVSRRLRHIRTKELGEHLDRGMSERLWVWGDERTPEEKSRGGHRRMMVAAWKDVVNA